MVSQNVIPEMGKLDPEFVSKYPIVVSIVRVTDIEYNSETIICIKDETINIETCETIIRTGDSVDETKIVAMDSTVKRCESLKETIRVIKDMGYTVDQIASIVDSFVTEIKKKLLQK